MSLPLPTYLPPCAVLRQLPEGPNRAAAIRASQQCIAVWRTVGHVRYRACCPRQRHDRNSRHSASASNQDHLRHEAGATRADGCVAVRVGSFNAGQYVILAQ